MKDNCKGKKWENRLDFFGFYHAKTQATVEKVTDINVL